MNFDLILFSLVIPVSLVIFTVWFLLRLGKKRPLEHKATRTEKDTLEEDSIEDSELDGLMSEGDILFPEEPSEDED